MRKLFIISTIAAFAVSPFGIQEKAHGMENQYSNLTEETSFYRVTRGFVAPLAELDNNLETKIEFSKGKYLTYMRYIFLKEVAVREIHFKSDTPQYQRIIVLRNGMIQMQFDLYKYPSGVIPMPSALPGDQIMIQFNGVEGSNHSLTELEIIGSPLMTGGNDAPTEDATFVTPDIISELIEKNATGDELGEGEPVPGEGQEIPEGEDGTDEESGGTPIDGTIPEGNNDTSSEDQTEGDPLPVDGIPEGDDGDGGEPLGGGTLPEEDEVDEEEGIGDTDYIDNGGEEGTPGIDPPVDPVIVPGEDQENGDGEVVIPEAPMEEEPVVIEPTVPETPITPDPPVVEEPEAPIGGPVLQDEELLAAKAMPLTPSVFSNKHIYRVYAVNAASMKLMEHKHYDEAFLIAKLSDSFIKLDGNYLSIVEFINMLKSQENKK